MYSVHCTLYEIVHYTQYNVYTVFTKHYTNPLQLSIPRVSHRFECSCISFLHIFPIYIGRLCFYVAHTFAYTHAHMYIRSRAHMHTRHSRYKHYKLYYVHYIVYITLYRVFWISTMWSQHSFQHVSIIYDYIAHIAIAKPYLNLMQVYW